MSQWTNLIAETCWGSLSPVTIGSIRAVLNRGHGAEACTEITAILDARDARAKQLLDADEQRTRGLMQAETRPDHDHATEIGRAHV